jgi:hypothetical protein
MKFSYPYNGILFVGKKIGSTEMEMCHMDEPWKHFAK